MEATSNKTLATRFSEEMYAKKEDVRNELKMSMIDGIWESILKYRNLFKKEINLYSLSSYRYHYCFTQTISSNINELTSRASKCLNSFVSMDDKEQQAIIKDSYRKILEYIGLFYGERLTPEFIETIFNNQVNNLQGISEAKKKANDYYHAIKGFHGTRHEINEDYLVTLYVKLSNNDNITTIYRNFDFVDNNANTVINRMYSNGAPKGRIEQSMGNLFKLLEDNAVTPLIKAITAFYYINYIKPFPSHNTEIALLTFKTIIGNDDKENIAYLLSIESLLTRKDEMLSVSKEIDRSNDLTYMLVAIFSELDKALDNFNEIYNNVKTSVLRREHISDTDEDIENEPKSLKEPVIKENEDISEFSKLKEVAIPSIESGLDEKDATKFEKFLLEKNPMLKDTQAHFYARHCTIGSYYTIQMFKKCERVVYETARTSMEALTKFGYYKKEQIKNKFVYTPIKLENK